MTVFQRAKVVTCYVALHYNACVCEIEGEGKKATKTKQLNMIIAFGRHLCVFVAMHIEISNEDN